MSNQNNKRNLDDDDQDDYEPQNSNSKRKQKKVDIVQDNNEENQLNLDPDFDEQDNGDEEYDEDSEDNDIDDEDDVEESGQDFSDKEISVEFTAYDPIESDFHGIKCLLNQLWLKENINFSELTDLLINDTITTVLKQSEEKGGREIEDDDSDNDDDDDDEDNIYGVISVIPFNSHFNGKECVKQIKQILLNYLPKDNEIHKALNDNKRTCALVINERFINLPPKISVPCYQQMLTELNSKSKSSDNLNDGRKFEFDHVIMISKLSKYKNEFIYSNGEDEIFTERAEAQYEYSVSKHADYNSVDWKDDEKIFEPFRKILLLTKAKWIRTINVLKDVL